MKTGRFLQLAASLLLALAFTLTACSSDDDGGGNSSIACKLPIPESSGGGSVCIEHVYPNGIPNEDKKYKDECRTRFNGEGYSSCPKGYVLKCDTDDTKLPKRLDTLDIIADSCDPDYDSCGDRPSKYIYIYGDNIKTRLVAGLGMNMAFN